MLKKITAEILAVLIVVSSSLTVFAADWTTYQGDEFHNGMISTAMSDEPSIQSILLPNNLQGKAWSGVDTAPVMETSRDGKIYAYVFYDSYVVNGEDGGGRLAKIWCDNPAGPSVVWEIQIANYAGFQLSTPYLDVEERAIYVGTTLFGFNVHDRDSIFKISNIDDTPQIEWSIELPKRFQVNTPIVRAGNYLYFGTWSGREGVYYQYNLEAAGNRSGLTSYTPPEGNGGFYWAGAIVKNDYVYFGGDGGYLYVRPSGDLFGNEGNEDFDNNGRIIELGSEAGNVRSTISLYNDNLYFTSQGGYLWCFTANGLDTSDMENWKTELAGVSTSTPTITNDFIYTGYYEGFTTGGIQRTPLDGGEAETIATPGPVQSSIICSANADLGNYLYFTTNSENGAGYCYLDHGYGNAEFMWTTLRDDEQEKSTYTLQGMAYSSGILTFGNDFNYFYVVGESEIPADFQQLNWPTDSSEITLWYGELDDQCAVFNQGMSIQGEPNSNVYSVGDGTVTYKGYSSVYGNLLYINFTYDGVKMQARYGNLAEIPSASVGQSVKQGDIIGQMGLDRSTENTGKGVIEIVLAKSVDGKDCEINGSNVEFVEPTRYLERRISEDNAYLTVPMATIRDTTGLNYTVTEEGMITLGANGISETEKDRRYRSNQNITKDEAYLRKLVLDVVKKLDNVVNNDNFDEKGYLTFNTSTGVATVSINKVVHRYGISLGNARIINSRMVVNEKTVTEELLKGQRGRYYPVLSETAVQDHNAAALRILQNYTNNERLNIPGGYINGQGIKSSDVSKMRYGNYHMDFNGCEIIAMYNALNALGNIHTLNDVANWGECNALWAGGLFGTKYTEIGSFFKSLRYPVAEYTKSQPYSKWDQAIQEADACIIVFLNDKSISVFGGIHTVTLRRKSSGGFYAYNRFSNETEIKEYKSIEDMIQISKQYKEIYPIELIILKK